MNHTEFITSKGDYHSLIVYKKAECIYDLTYHFAHRFLQRGDRTVDQMIQAARSGKQNIIEGSSAAKTSRETEIKLFNVAKASLDELLADYEDFLRVRNLVRWSEQQQREVREFCRQHTESEFYRQIAPKRDASTLANLAITMIHQEIYLLLRLIERAKKDFLERGGIREEMTRARLAFRQKGHGNYGNYGKPENPVKPENSPTLPSTPTPPTNPITPPNND